MQNTSDKSQVKQDERSNGEEDSRMITIEYLRARLLSERSISKATKERADELANRVKELEDQLKVVTLRRKRAEKAALDVYSYLDSVGVSDISEVYESDSNEDESQYDSYMDNGDTTKVHKAFGSLEIERNDREPLGSEPEFTLSSGRSLSWKGRKDSTRLLDKKGLKSSIRSRTSLAQVNSSPRQRLGKSCRQIKRRESRSMSTIEEPRHDSRMSNAQDSNAMDCLDRGLDCLDFQSMGSRKSPERYGQRGSGKDKVSCSYETQAQEYDAGSSSHEHECSGEMERARHHQAQLIKCYEAQEKDQIDWEEKYGENNDSCEPGSHSDVTEERDENKATVPQLVDVGACQDHKVGMQTNSLGRKLSITHFNSFKLSPDATGDSTEKHKFSEMQPCGSPAPEFAFSAANNNQSLEHAARHSLQGHDDPSQSGSVSCELQPPWKNDSRALVPHEEPSYRVGTVLEALHEAKLLIKQQINNFPDTKISVSQTNETSVPANGNVDWLKIPVGCPGLFRVPYVPDCQSLSQCTLPSSNHLSELTSSALDTRPLAVQGHQYISCLIGSQLSSPSADSLFSTPDISNRQPRFDFQFNINISASGNSNELTSCVFPDFFPHMPSHHMMDSQFPRINDGIPSYGYPSFQNHDVRSDTYRDR